LIFIKPKELRHVAKHNGCQYPIPGITEA